MESNDRVKSLRQKYPYGHPGFITLCLEEIKLHSDKNRDYTGGEGFDPLGNFNRVSDTFLAWGMDIPCYLVAFIYMMKQIDAVGNMFGQHYEGEVEGLRERLLDIAVYAKLVGLLYEEEAGIDE